MTRSTIKDWKVESIFRDLSLKGIRIDENLWLQSKYRDFQEKEDPGLRTHPMYLSDSGMSGMKKKVERYGDFEYIRDPSQEGPSCSMLECVVRRSTKDKEESGNE